VCVVVVHGIANGLVLCGGERVIMFDHVSCMKYCSSCSCGS